jgi:ribosomal protein L32
MLEDDHRQLIIAIARHGRYNMVNVVHLARRAGFPVSRWCQIAREVEDHGYGYTYDRGVTLTLTDDGWHEAVRLVQQRRQATEAKENALQHCQRCGHAISPAARYCGRCGFNVSQ